MPINLSSNFPGGFSRAATPQMDRRDYADRRTPLKPMPLAQGSWAQQIVVAGCIGALVGGTAAFAFGALAQLQTSADTIAVSPAGLQAAAQATVEATVPAVAIMAPLFDTAPFVGHAPSAKPVLSNVARAENPAGEPQSESSGGSSSGSYSEDAADVPSATYHEPPKSADVSALDDR